MGSSIYEYYRLSSFLSRKCKEHCIPMFGMQYDNFQSILTMNCPVARVLIKNQVPLMNITFPSVGRAEIQKVLPIQVVEGQLQQKYMHPFIPMQQKEIFLHRLKELSQIKAMNYRMLAYTFLFYDLTSVPEYASKYNIKGIPAFSSSVSSFEQQVAYTTPDAELEKLFFIGRPYRLTYNQALYEKPIFKNYVYGKKLGLRVEKPKHL